MVHKRAVLLALALLLSACGLRSGGRAAETQAVAWLVSSSRDGAIELAHPADWQLAEAAEGKLGLVSADGCRLLLLMSPGAKPEGQTQPEVLEDMLSTAEFACFRDGLEFEPTGRRVWMGESLVWHEVHYRGQPRPGCSNCTSRYSVEMLAFPEDPPGRLSVSLSCPGVDPPTPETVQLLLDMLNTLALSVVGSA